MSSRQLSARAFKAISLTVCLVSGVLAAPAQATRYVDLHDFGGTVTNADGKSGSDGGAPMAGVTFDSAGNMYGTTSLGGANNYGVVWEYTTAKKYIDLHDFGGTVTNADGKSGPDGGYSQAGVTFDASGNMYGTASYGGPDSFGMVWEITKAGKYLDLHDFGGSTTNADGKSGPDGLSPYANVVFDSGGNMYGTASGGGQRYNGMVWEITKAGKYFDLHDFGGTITNANGKSGPDGMDPNGGLAFDAAGDMCGATDMGGPYNATNAGDGMVWKLTKAGVYSDLHDFGGVTTNADGKGGPDGYNPNCTVVFDAAGDMYGTASNGGATNSGPANQRGIVWEITKAGAYRDLHDFGGFVVNASGSSGPDGGYPAAAVVFDTLGNMFGTTENSGAYASGMVWEITSSGSYRDLHDFGGYALNSNGVSVPDGALGGPPVAFYAGNMYGTTILGGANDADNGGDGMVWQLGTSVDAPTVSLSPTSVYGSVSATGTVTLAFPLATPLTVDLKSSSADATAPSSIVVPAGKSSATFTVKTVAVPKNVTATITATVVAVEGNTSGAASLTVESPVLSKAYLSPLTVVGGTSATGYGLLSSPAPTGGWVVTLTSSSSVAKVPASITVTAGATKSPTFAVTTVPVATDTTVVITVTSANYYVKFSLVVDAPYLYGFVLNPTSVIGGASSTGTVTISSAAPTGGLKVTLASNSKSATVPATVTIPAGKTSATFTVTTSKVTTQTTAAIKATYGVFQTGYLTIKP